MILAHEIIGEGTPLVFLHGLGADRRQTTGSLAALAESHDLQLIAVDFRSHGDSVDDSDGTKLNFDSFADDVIALMDHLGLDRPHLGGLSMGSGVSLNIALRYPERAASLILLRPSWLDAPCPAHLAIVANVGKWIVESDLTSAEAKLNTDAEFLALSEREPTVAASIPPLFARPQAVEGASVLYKMFESQPFDSLESLQKITQPAIVLDTTHDDLHPKNVATSIADQLSNLAMYSTLPPRYLEKDNYNKALRQELIDFLVL